MKLRLYILIFFSIFSLEINAITLKEAKDLVNAGDYTRAVVAFRSLIQQPAYARNAEVNKFYGQCLCMTGEYEESLKYLEAGAKGGKTGALWYLGISKQHLYDFEGALENLEKYRKICTAASGWLQRTDSIIAECKLGLRAVNHVQDVVIVDSLLVPKQNFFAHYKLGPESGHIVSPAECGRTIHQLSDSSAAVFESLAEDYRLMAIRNNEDNSYNLYSSTFLEGIWNAPEKIESIGGENCKVAYPFLRSDSETLYFACDSTPGIGGLDIYVTHYNSETNSYYSPNRLGMPFNSPYDDYMMAIDETNQVGWWATERGAKPGFVCIYIFKVEDEPEYLEGENISRARIDRIADTWRPDESYDELISQIHNPSAKTVVGKKVFIPIRDGIVYTSANDFKNPQARNAYETSLKIEESLAEAKEDLRSLRESYSEANAASRRQLQVQILQKEKVVLTLQDQLKSLRKQYRNQEK